MNRRDAWWYFVSGCRIGVASWLTNHAIGWLRVQAQIKHVAFFFLLWIQQQYQSDQCLFHEMIFFKENDNDSIFDHFYNFYLFLFNATSSFSLPNLLCVILLQFINNLLHLWQEDVICFTYSQIILLSISFGEQIFPFAAPAHYPMVTCFSMFVIFECELILSRDCSLLVLSSRQSCFPLPCWGLESFSSSATELLPVFVPQFSIVEQYTEYKSY